MYKVDLIMRKQSDEFKLKIILQNNWLSCFKDVNVMKSILNKFKFKNLGNCSTLKEKDMIKNVMHNLLLDSGSEKYHKGQYWDKWGDLNIEYTLDIVLYQS